MMIIKTLFMLLLVALLPSSAGTSTEADELSTLEAMIADSLVQLAAIHNVSAASASALGTFADSLPLLVAIQNITAAAATAAAAAQATAAITLEETKVIHAAWTGYEVVSICLGLLFLMVKSYSRSHVNCCCCCCRRHVTPFSDVQGDNPIL